jgi:hypothetical protein
MWLKECERQTAGHPRGGRFECGSGQRSCQIRLVNASQLVPGGSGILAQPGQFQLIADSNDDQSVRGAMPCTGQLWKRDSELECRMHCLTRLHPWCQIGTGDDIQAVGGTALTVRHAISVLTPRPCCHPS